MTTESGGLPAASPEASAKPWHDCPPCPKGCGKIGCLRPYRSDLWNGPIDATLFCPACGAGWYGIDAEIEQALAAEAWWEAFEDSGLSEVQFVAAHVEEPESCGKTCFRRGCQHPEQHFGRNAKLCAHADGAMCGRDRFLLRQYEARQPPAGPPGTK